jgi:hypothetical protein
MATFLASGEVHDDYQEEAENDDRKLGEKAQRNFRGGGMGIRKLLTETLNREAV